MHVFYESNPSNEDKVYVCDDDDLIEVTIESDIKNVHVKQFEHQDEVIQ